MIRFGDSITGVLNPRRADRKCNIHSTRSIPFAQQDSRFIVPRSIGIFYSYPFQIYNPIPALCTVSTRIPISDTVDLERFVKFSRVIASCFSRRYVPQPKLGRLDTYDLDAFNKKLAKFRPGKRDDIFTQDQIPDICAARVVCGELISMHAVRKRVTLNSMGY